MTDLKSLLTYVIANWETLLGLWQGALVALSTVLEFVATLDTKRSIKWKAASKVFGTFAVVDGGRLVRYLKLVLAAQDAAKLLKPTSAGLLILLSLGCSSTLEQSRSEGLSRLSHGQNMVSLATRNTARCHQLSDREANWKAVETVSAAFSLGFTGAAWPVESDRWEMVVVGTGVAGAAVTAYAESRRRSAQESWAEECSQ